MNAKEDQVQQLGVNLGAPGDRQAENGTLWLDYPSVGGSSPVVSLKLSGADLEYYHKHSSFVEEGDLKWVAASGVEGASALSVTLSTVPTPERSYTVRLYFLEPQDLKTGERVFDVSLQGKPVLPELDILKAAGGANRAIVREFNGVRCSTSLQVDLTAIKGRTLLSGVEIVVEK